MDALFDSEKIAMPTMGRDSDCKPNTTVCRNSHTDGFFQVHVDGFLYDEDDVDKLVDKGKISRNFCGACGSRDVRPLTFISHSLSLPQVTSFLANK